MKRILFGAILIISMIFVLTSCDESNDGKDGVTPTVQISDDGYWVINSEKTAVKAQGENGDKGDKGDKGDNGTQGIGIKSVAFDENGNLLITFTDNSTQTVEMPEKAKHVHSFGEWENISDRDVSCEERIFCRACAECGFAEWKKGAEHALGDWIPEVASNCTTDGTKGHYNCSVCDKNFDANKTKLQSLVINKTGAHNFVNEFCTKCNAEIVYSRGLSYERVNQHYKVVGIGDCADTELYIPKSYNNLPVREIDASAFMDCARLENVIIPDSVETIGNLAFSSCANLASIVIPYSVISIGDYAFEACANLASITVDKNNEYYKSIDGNLYTKDGKTLIQYAVGKSDTSFTIPNSVTSIGDSAFRDCTSLTSVTIPDSVTSIGWHAFSNCTSLTSITVYENNAYYKDIDGNLYSKDGKTLIQYAIGKTDTSFAIPNGVTSIGDDAFCNCTSLTSVTIPDSVTSIGDDAFMECTRLKNVIIPDSVEIIGSYTFYYCENLENVYYTGTETEWTEISIGDANEDLTDATIHYNYVPEQ